MLVLRTLPGSAHAIAAALDRARWPEVAGSIAGDDTLFAVPDRASLQRVRSAACTVSLVLNDHGGVTDLLTPTGDATTIRVRLGLQARGGPAIEPEVLLLSADRPPVVHVSATRQSGEPIVNNKPTYLSKDGLEKLRAELEEMTNVRRVRRSPIGSTTPRNTAT